MPYPRRAHALPMPCPCPTHAVPMPYPRRARALPMPCPCRARVPAQAKQLVEALMRKDASERLTIEQMLQHPWLLHEVS